jgi:hypothetical protein
MQDTFKFRVDADVDLVKSQDEGEWYIQGYASTPDQDRQGESLVQKGLDITDFVNYGYLNYDHNSAEILGYPTENTRVDDHGLWVEGKLLKHVEKAKWMWETAVALKKSNAPRKLGFSVEGKVLERQGDKIVKAKIYHCAITPSPVNTNATWEAVVKSFSSGGMSKSLEAGYATSPLEQSGGGAHRTESIECQIKQLAENLDNFNFWQQVKSNMANGQTVSKSEAVVFLQLSKGLSRQQALDIINKTI